MSGGSGPDTVITVEDVRLSFPLVRLHAGGVKEAFLRVIQRGGRTREPRVFWAIDGVSMRVAKGEVLGLVGRNGSGKSTLLRVIAGIYEPDEGRVETRGRISSLLELGAGFRDELTGFENVKLSCAISGFSPDEIGDLLPGIIEFSGLEDFMQQPLKTYSSGMRARLGFAVASAGDPEILLIDEALAVGDASFRERCMQRIESLVSDEDVTVIVVSHSMGELRRLCSRLVLLERGKIVSEGDVKSVVKQYKEIIAAGAAVRRPA